MTINIVADRSTHDHVGALKKKFSSITYYFNLVTVFIFTTTSKYVAERELSADNLEDILAAAAEPMQLTQFCVYTQQRFYLLSVTGNCTRTHTCGAMTSDFFRRQYMTVE